MSKAVNKFSPEARALAQRRKVNPNSDATRRRDRPLRRATRMAVFCGEQNVRLLADWRRWAY